MSAPVWKRIGPGVYDSADGRFTLEQIPGCRPPAWNVSWATAEVLRREDVDPENFDRWYYGTLLVDGAASFRDAKALAVEATAALDRAPHPAPSPKEAP